MAGSLDAFRCWAVDNDPGSVVPQQDSAVQGPGWATRDDMMEDFEPIMPASIHARSGIPILYTADSVYIDSSDRHTMVIGGTGSKKSRCCLGPLTEFIAATSESALVIDPKGEILDWTYDSFKANGRDVKVFDLRTPASGDRWNPMQMPYTLMKSDDPGVRNRGVRVMCELANYLIPVEGADPFWPLSARSLLFGMMLVLADRAKDASEVTLKNLNELVTQTFSSEDRIRKLMSSITDSGVLSNIATAANNAENTRKCILAYVYTALGPFVGDPDLGDAMSGDDIDIMSVGGGKDTIFLILPDERPDLSPLASVFVSQLYESLIWKAQSEDCRKLPERFNIIIDEFGNLNINGMAGMITAARSRNIRFCLAIQSTDQLDWAYKANGRVILNNCGNIVYLYSRDIPFLKQFSYLIGNGPDGEPLISPGELMRLDLGEAVMLCGRGLPIRVKLKDISEMVGKDRLYKSVKRTPLANKKFDAGRFLRRKSVGGDILDTFYE